MDMCFTAEIMRARRIAREEGFAEGLAEGLAEARAKRRAEIQCELVKEFLLAGTPIEYLIKATGWTEEQILAAKLYKGDEEDPQEI